MARRRKEKKTRNRAKVYPIRLNLKVTVVQHEKLKRLAETAGTDISDRIRVAIDSIPEPTQVPEWTTPSHKEVDPFDPDYEDIMAQVAAISGPQATEPQGGKALG